MPKVNPKPDKTARILQLRKQGLSVEKIALAMDPYVPVKTVREILIRNGVSVDKDEKRSW